MNGTRIRFRQQGGCDTPINLTCSTSVGWWVGCRVPNKYLYGILAVWGCATDSNLETTKKGQHQTFLLDGSF